MYRTFLKLLTTIKNSKYTVRHRFTLVPFPTHYLHNIKLNVITLHNSFGKYNNFSKHEIQTIYHYESFSALERQ